MNQFDSHEPDPEDLQKKIERLEAQVKKLLEEQHRAKAGPATPPNAQEATSSMPMQAEGQLITEADATLRRLVQRIAMILQAEKVAIMFYDRERGELIGIRPAFGIEEERLTHFRVRAAHGISGEVFGSGVPAVYHDVLADPRTQEDPFSLLNVTNGITVPLILEKRDEENRVVDRNTIGVLHAFNKRHGENFDDEDMRLLERLAKNVSSIIANLQLYREVVEEREELLQTFESITFGLILVSTEGRISQINSSARQLLHLRSDPVGKNYKDHLRNDQLIAFFDNLLLGHETAKLELNIEIGGAQRILEVQGTVVRNEEGKQLGAVAIVNDVTDIRNVDKMKSSFVAMASHELRTPLTAIKGFVRTLLDGEDYFTASDRHEFHSIIDQECDRLRRLIDDLLNTARIEAGESLKPNYTSFALKPILEKALMIQNQATDGRHQLSLEIENDLPEDFIGDQDKLEQVLTNLLNNAIKYSPGGGKITIHAKNEGEDTLIGVQDEGLGIPKDHLTKVFEKFHRVNNEDNRKIYGTGLGLYLVQNLVERVHMGKIWAESEVGVGSTFWIRLPNNLDIEKAKTMND